VLTFEPHNRKETIVRKPSPATIIATIALFVALGGVAVAAPGDNFILGRANISNKQTSLSGAAANPELRVENTSTDGNARGVVGVISAPTAAAGSAGIAGVTASTDPGSVGVLAQNTGGGPALMAAVNPGAPPLAVSSAAKVTNLNADQLDGMSSSAFLGANATAANANKLDGLDSTQFVQGGGSVNTIHASLTIPANGKDDIFYPNPPGPLGSIINLFAQCFDNYNGQTGANIELVSVNGNMTLARESSQGPTTVITLGNIGHDDSPVLPADHFKWHGHWNNLVFTIDTWTYKIGLTCTFDMRLIVDP
jgi:hypothetical protein